MKATWIDAFMPPMRCDEGCGECCGVAPATQSEFDSLREYAQRKGIVARRQGTRCPFYQEGQCAVYEARPGSCRMFGHVPDMECPRGYNVNIRPKAEQFVMLTIQRELKEKGLRLVHELAYTFSEMNDLIEDQMQDSTIKARAAAQSSSVVIQPDNLTYQMARMLVQVGKNRRPFACYSPTTDELDMNEGTAARDTLARREAPPT